MPTIEEAKNRRDEALQAWRNQFKLLNLYEPGTQEWERQRLNVQNARCVYSAAADEYIHMLTKPKRPTKGAA